MNRSKAKAIALKQVVKGRRFRIITEHHREFRPLYAVVERISENEHRYVLNEQGSQTWYARYEDARELADKLDGIRP